MNNTTFPQNLLSDLIKFETADAENMKKYGLDHLQMVFVLSELAEKRKISFQRVIAWVNHFLDLEDYEAADDCLSVIKNEFAGKWGILAIIKGIEHRLITGMNKYSINKNMKQSSKSMDWFASKFPDIPVHPSVARQFQVMDRYLDKNFSNEGPLVARKMLKTSSRLYLYAKYHILFFGLDASSATRLWHFLMINFFLKNGITHYRVANIMDAVTCDVCLNLENTVLNIADANDVLFDCLEKKVFFPEKDMPEAALVDNLPQSQRIEMMKEHRWYLPPFCENCRCQIIPAKPPR